MPNNEFSPEAILARLKESGGEVNPKNDARGPATDTPLICLVDSLMSLLISGEPISDDLKSAFKAHEVFVKKMDTLAVSKCNGPEEIMSDLKDMVKHATTYIEESSVLASNMSEGSEAKAVRELSLFAAEVRGTIQSKVDKIESAIELFGLLNKFIDDTNDED